MTNLNDCKLQPQTGGMSCVGSALENDRGPVPGARDGAPGQEIDHLERHMFNSYHVLRLGTGVVALVFPLVLWWMGLAFGIQLQGSMSAYYHTAMRDVFVGLLFAVGAFLYLYKGFSRTENLALNCAGLAAVTVALVPTGTSLVHGAAAVFLFLCIGYVAIFKHADTVKYIIDPERANLYRRTYKILGILMIGLPLIAAVLIGALEYHLQHNHLTFAVEFAGVAAFAAYWLVKGQEIRRTQRDASGDASLAEGGPAPRLELQRSRGAERSRLPEAAATPDGKARPEATYLA